ncbi:MAG: rhamnulose-1-phosphate aldolase [Erysipelotrichaceae bacterium]|nr:rhamnulose-1-phosphate aldolase [Erysipelotrichaceae bacterium]MBR5049695.1 rhamnulose-1-phosphate aldolase [Erysipelotrichaceae bacterium]
MDTRLVRDFTKVCSDGYDQGWHERNGGNLSYRMRDEEVEEIRDLLNEKAEWREIGTEVPDLANEYFMVTGSGKYMRNVQLDFADNVAVIKLNEDGTKYKIVWGLVNGGRPTSELPSHLMNLEVLKHRDPEMRVVYHAHPANTVALTFVLPLDGEVFTREIWEMETECPVVFPQGIGVIEWMVPGGREIGVKTSEIMKTQNVAIWYHHGMFVCGHDFDEAFGLMHTVEKAAEMLVKVMSMSERKLNTITPEGFRAIARDFHVDIDEKYLYEKKSNKIGER